jgi:molecular chaperone GrpE
MVTQDSEIKHDEQQALVSEQGALAVCQQQLQEWKDKAFRIGADFENFKRRLEKDQGVLQRSFQTGILLDMISVVDNFDRALKDVGSEDATSVGFALIYKELKKMLEKYGVVEIVAYTHFDPEVHEAVVNVPGTDKESGTIIEILQKGYTYKDHVLRPAKVSIAQ